MSIISRMRKQKAIWWKRGSVPDRYGKFTFESPVEVACRWEDVSKEFIDAQGAKRISQSVVYVDRVMSPGDYLLLGELDSNTVEDPATAGAFLVSQFSSVPNLKATETLYTAYL